jgi:transposase
MLECDEKLMLYLASLPARMLDIPASSEDSIDGINGMTAFTVISEVGTDLSRFQDEKHFTSWMGLAPSRDISGGKVVGSGKKKVKNRVAVVLRTAAVRLLRSDTHLGARYRHLRSRLPTPPKLTGPKDRLNRDHRKGGHTKCAQKQRAGANLSYYQSTKH